jgi:hypothetical protein
MGNRALGGPAKFDDHHCRAHAYSKLASETIMGGRISEDPSSSVEEHYNRQRFLNFRGSDKV